MSPESLRVFARISLLLVLTLAGFTAGQQAVRDFETSATVNALRLLGVTGVSHGLTPTSVIVDAGPRGVFALVLSPSCSSLASLLALASLAVLRPPGSRTRLVLAVTAAMALVFVGNIVRITASLGVGLLTGPSSLVLFHDWVGSLFGFAYTLGVFLLMLWLLLPRDGVPLEELCATPASPGVPGVPPGSAGSAAPTAEAVSPEPLGLAVGGGLVALAALHSALTRRAVRHRLRAALAHAEPSTRVAAVQTAGENGVGRNARILLAAAGTEADIWVRQVLAQTVTRHRWEPASTRALVDLRIWAKQELLWGRLESGDGDAPGTGPDGVTAEAVLTESGWWVA